MVHESKVKRCNIPYDYILHDCVNPPAATQAFSLADFTFLG